MPRRCSRWRAAVVTVVVFFLAGSVLGRETSEEDRETLDPNAVRSLMVRVADWQLAYPRFEPAEWSNAVFYAGLLAAYRATGEDHYLAAVTQVGEGLGWKPGARDRHADDHAIGQSYLEIFEARREERMIAPLRATLDRMMSAPPDWRKRHQPIDYWWSDALFMSPPVLSRLARLTGDERYLDFMDELWRESYDLLWDEEDRLFYRDLRFRRRSPGEFWSRGNAWVLAGIARMLEDIPEQRGSRGLYVDVFRKMSQRVVGLQPPDGMWRSNLVASAASARGEASGTALFCYAIAAGIRMGIVDDATYRPAVERAWRALVRAVDDDGRLGWVQQPGVAPDRVTARDSAPYGAGALLLAGAELVAAGNQ